MKQERKKKLTWAQETSSISWTFIVWSWCYVAPRGDVVLVMLVVTWRRVEVVSVIRERKHIPARLEPLLSSLGATLVVTWRRGDPRSYTTSEAKVNIVN
jgi:hypothetical protein